MKCLVPLPQPVVQRGTKSMILTFSGDRVCDVEKTIASELRRPNEPALQGHLVLNFAHVKQLSCAELGSLVVLYRRTQVSGGRLTLLNLSAWVLEVFRITRLDSFLEIHGDHPHQFPPEPINRLANTGSQEGEKFMEKALRAVAFDVDAASLDVLREALPSWEIEVVNGSAIAGASHDWNPGPMDLLLVMARQDLRDTLGLCRLLVGSSLFARDQHHAESPLDTLYQSPQKRARGADAPLVVLVPPGQESLVRAALDAGADGCLIVPLHTKEIVRTLAHIGLGNQPGRHTRDLDRPQTEDAWRDDGGQG